MKPGIGPLIAGAALLFVGAFIIPVVTVLTLIGGMPQMQEFVAPGTAEHNPHKFTSRHPGPWVLVHREGYSSRREAIQRERWLKCGAGRAWLDDHVGRASPAERE